MENGLILSGDEFMRMVSFESIDYHVTHKTKNLNDTVEGYLENARTFLKKLSDEIDENEIEENRKIILGIHPWIDINSYNALQHQAQYFADAANWVTQMRANPRTFYDTGEAAKLQGLARRISKFYENIESIEHKMESSFVN